MWVLDTNIVSHVQYGSGPEYDRIRVRLEAADAPVVATVPGMEEQFRGRLAVCHQAKTADDYVTAAAYLRRTFDFYVGLPVLDFDDRAAAEYDRLKRAKNPHRHARPPHCRHRQVAGRDARHPQPVRLP